MTWEILFLAAMAAAEGTHQMPQPLPPLVLWAWERPEDLRFLDPRRHAVAVLVGTLSLTGDGIHPRGRRQPLTMPTGTRLLAVVRLESDRRHPPTLSAEQRRRTVEAVLGWSGQADAEGLQIDFDATLSERTFYRDLLTDLRRRLPSHLSLQMTALASWCLGDPWLRDLPVDQVVPMLFRMGMGGPTIRRRLEGGEDFQAGLCRSNVGFSTDEPLVHLPSDRRHFVFHPGSWTPEAFSTLNQHLEDQRR